MTMLCEACEPDLGSHKVQLLFLKGVRKNEKLRWLT